MDVKSNRRTFFKYLSIPPLAMAAGGILAHSNLALGNPAGAAKFVADTDPTAKALGYVADATKAERPAKAGVEGKDQLCNNCQLYTKGDAIGGEEAGKCLMLPSGAVHGKGWCKSWIKKS